MPNRYPKDQLATHLNRRHFFKAVGVGAVGVMSGGVGPLLSRAAAGAAQTRPANSGFTPDLDIRLTAAPDEVPLFPGSLTQVWRYKADLIRGDATRLIDIPGSYLGPIIKANKGDKVRIRFTNRIPADTIIHWHGLHVPAVMDGHPRYVVSKEESYLYEFEIKNRAGTYWYHPHPHGQTGYQVYGGMAGLLLVSDDEEKVAGLPGGEYDIALVLQDRTFDSDNQLVYLPGGRMEFMTGFIGDRILVNGKPDFRLDVSTRSYRLRLLNGSNSRIYKLAWQDKRPLTVVGTDGGLLEKPTQRPYAYLSPGERLELWADFSDDPVGFETALVSLPFDAGIAPTGPMRGGMMGSGGRYRQRLPNGSEFPVFKVNVQRRAKENQPLPQRLSHVGRVNPKTAINYYTPRQFYLSMGHMRWAINGRTFQMDEVANDEIVRLGSTEVWEFFNTGGGMGMMGRMNMPHPVHLHGKQFRVLERGGVVHSGYVDEGWKDTVLLMPGESVRILVDFADYEGLYLYHCHNLEHEDMGMMRNYLIKA
jgi:FtsP/CotA-like multicopper oxidase with cupredoxin domain